MRNKVLLLLFLVSCSSHSLEEYQYEGEALCKVLVKDLKKIESKEDFSSALPALKKHFHALVSLMIEAKNVQKKHPKEEIDVSLYEHVYVDALKEEMVRISSLEGGREMLEKAQREALILLSKY